MMFLPNLSFSWQQYQENMQFAFAVGETLFHRGLMIGTAMNGGLPHTHSEFNRMVTEKVSAAIEGQWAMFTVWQKAWWNAALTGSPLTQKAMQRTVDTMTVVGFAPTRRTVMANARRLRKHKR